MFVEKRDLTTEPFNQNLIKNAMTKAFTNVRKTADPEVIDELLRTIVHEINHVLLNDKSLNGVISIEQIQTIVENTLMASYYYDVARHYIEYRNTRNATRKETPYDIIKKLEKRKHTETPWGMLGYITYKRTYSRRKNEEDLESEETEEFHDTICRILKASKEQLKIDFTNREIERAYDYFKQLKCSVAGRFLWQLGTRTVDKLGLMSLQNCAFVNIDGPIEPFLWIFDVLMLGTGVGFNIQKINVEKIPPVLNKKITITRETRKDSDFIVPDSREGWVSLLEKLLESYFYKGNSFTYSTVLIRGAGEKISGFGGHASGPEELVKFISCIQKVLNSRLGQKLRPIDCLDIVNIIATCVVAGNVRRCLPKGSLVHTRTGLKKIEFVNTKDEVLTTEGYQKVLNNFYQGWQQLIKISTVDGFFSCTSKHKMAVMNSRNEIEWKEAGSLKAGESLILSMTAIEGTKKYLSYSGTHILLDENVSWLFGIFEANLIFDKVKPKATFLLRTVDALNKARNILENYFDVEISSGVSQNGLYQVSINSQRFINLLSEYLHEPFINMFLDSYQDSKLGYIAGLVDTYGKVSSNSNLNPVKTYTARLLINLSDQFVRDFQALGYSCGMSFRLIKRNLKNYFEIKECLYFLEHSSSKYEVDNIVYTPGIKKTQIYSVSNGQFESTYDIEVENKHEFFCNGYLTHNSALIALGDPDDKEFLNAKRWDLGGVPNWRCMSNNSVICSDIDTLPDEFWEGYKGNGEPYGLINLDLSRKIGRTKDGDKYPDPLVDGYNPCAEISLPNKSTCNLSEIFLPNVNSYEELRDIATILYRLCKHSLMLPCHQKSTEDIVHSEMRIGIGVTGYMQCEQYKKDWLSDIYEYLREYDRTYSAKHGVPTSVKLTTCKPSGTLSILPGVTPGCHPGIYQYFIRRIRIAANNKLIDICKKKGYHTEYQRNFDGTQDHNTIIVEFPCMYPIGTKLAKDTTAIDQLEVVKELQHNWSDNAVSCTVYYRLEELEEIKEWMRKNYTNCIKSCSFLLHNDHGFDQAPYEEITKEKYEELIAKVKPITSGNIEQQEDDDVQMEVCKGGMCPIR